MPVAGVLPNYAEMPADRFVQAFPNTTLVGINFNQESPADLRDSAIPWEVQRNLPRKDDAWGIAAGKTAIAKGRRVLWSVPFPGGGQMEAVNDGRHDDLYRSIADEILRAEPGTHPIYVRPPWEFNLRGNPENLMLDKNGNVDPVLGLRAWRRIAMLFRCKSSRFKLVWSPDVEHPTSEAFDPLRAWPGVEYVDVIAPDMYLGYAFGHKPGDYTGNWFRTPFLRLRQFAFDKGKMFGLAETGADHDDFMADVRMWLDDAVKAPSGCAFVSWWDDWQVIDCLISTGLRPKLADAYRLALL